MGGGPAATMFVFNYDKFIKVPQSNMSQKYQGAVALTVGSVPRRIVPELRHFHWLLKMNNRSNRRNSKTVLRGTDPIVSATACRHVCVPLKKHRTTYYTKFVQIFKNVLTFDNDKIFYCHTPRFQGMGGGLNACVVCVVPVLEVYQFARDASVAEAWLVAHEPYLHSQEYGVSRTNNVVSCFTPTSNLFVTVAMQSSCRMSRADIVLYVKRKRKFL